MGNVLAASKPLSSAATQFLSSNEPSLGADGGNGKNSDSEPLDNPGTIEELNKKCKGKFSFKYPFQAYRDGI